MDYLQFLPSIRMKTVMDLNRRTIGILKCCSIMSGKRHEQRIRTSDSNRRLLDLWPDIYGTSGFEMDGGAVLVLVASEVAIADVSRSQRALHSDGLALLPVAQA